MPIPYLKDFVRKIPDTLAVKIFKMQKNKYKPLLFRCIWMANEFHQKQLDEKDIGLILKAKEKVRHPEWQDVCHGSDILNSYQWAQHYSLMLENGLLKWAWESADGQESYGTCNAQKGSVMFILKRCMLDHLEVPSNE